MIHRPTKSQLRAIGRAARILARQEAGRRNAAARAAARACRIARSAKAAQRRAAARAKFLQRLHDTAQRHKVLRDIVQKYGATVPNKDLAAMTGYSLAVVEKAMRSFGIRKAYGRDKVWMIGRERYYLN